MGLIENMTVNNNIRNNNTECYVPLVNHTIRNDVNQYMRKNEIYSAYHANQMNKLLSKLSNVNDLYRGISGTICKGDIIIDPGINSKSTNLLLTTIFSEHNHILYFPRSGVINMIKCSDHEENEYVNWTVKQIIGDRQLLFLNNSLCQI